MKIRFFLILAFLALSACGGGGSGSTSPSPSPTPAPTSPESGTFDSSKWDESLWQ